MKLTLFLFTTVLCLKALTAYGQDFVKVIPQYKAIDYLNSQPVEFRLVRIEQTEDFVIYNDLKHDLVIQQGPVQMLLTPARSLTVPCNDQAIFSAIVTTRLKVSERIPVVLQCHERLIIEEATL